MRRRSVPVTIDVPIDVLKFIDEHSDEFTALLSNIVIQARIKIRQVEFEENANDQSYDRLESFVQLGRTEYRKYRQIQRNGDFGGLKGPALDQVVFEQLYDPASGNHQRQIFAVKQFRRAIGKRLLARRNREIIRLVGLGQSNNCIADRYSLAPGTVKQIVTKFRRDKRSIGDPRIGGFIRPGGHA